MEENSNVSDQLKNALDIIMKEATVNMKHQELLEAIKTSAIAARTAYHYLTTPDLPEVIAIPEDKAVIIAEDAFVAVLEQSFPSSMVFGLDED